MTTRGDGWHRPNWADALVRLGLVDLVCPHCGTANRPGVALITLEPTGVYLCATCAKDWPVPPPTVLTAR